MSDEEIEYKEYKPKLTAPKEPICEELGYISEKEFNEFSDKDKWRMIQAASKIITEYRIGADKNCKECEHHLLLNLNDINIDYLFEDWRHCSEICEETGKCTKENQIMMCNLQLEIMNLLSQEIRELEIKMNSITKMVLKRSDIGKEILDESKKEAELVERLNKHSNDIYQ